MSLQDSMNVCSGRFLDLPNFGNLTSGCPEGGWWDSESVSLKSSTFEPGRFRILTGMKLVPRVKNPRQQNCAGVELNWQKQIARMICHLLKAISFVEIDRGWLRVHHKTNTTNFTGNTSYPVYGIE